MAIFWLFLYIALLGFISVLIPFAIFFYESDPERSILQRLLRSFGYLLLTLVISSMILFISWNFLQYVDLPFTEISHTYSDVPYVDPSTQI